MIEHIPESGSIGGRALFLLSGLDEAAYRQQLDALVTTGKIVIGPGRGGSIRRIDWRFRGSCGSQLRG